MYNTKTSTTNLLTTLLRDIDELKMNVFFLLLISYTGQRKGERRCYYYRYLLKLINAWMLCMYIRWN